MAKLATFNFGNQEIRTATDEHGEVWFVANDICAALGLANPRKALADHVDAEDVTQKNTPTSGGNQQLNHVNESGLYALIFGSRKESAKRFKRWVTSEVLPAIRKDGYYATNPAPLSFRAQGHDYPSRLLEEDVRKVELLAQFAGLNHSDKLTLLAKMVWQHDKSFATIITTARDRVAELANANAKDSPEIIEHSLSAR